MPSGLVTEAFLAGTVRPDKPIMNSSENVPGSAGWTLLTLVVDRSGSMAGIKEEMERGIRALIEEQARGEERCFVTLTQFDDEFEVVADGVSAERIRPYKLEPRNGTALLDAIGRTIALVHLRIERMRPEDRPTTVVFAVITDGGENASRQWSRLQIREAIEAKTAEGWYFTFLGTDEEALEEGLALGVHADSLLMWERSHTGAAGAMKSLSDSSRRLRSGSASRIDYTEAEREAASGRLIAQLPTPWVRPYLFLDVDGVLNVFEKDLGCDAEMFDDFRQHDVDFDVVAGYHRSVAVCLSPAMGARIARLAVDIHWVTTWEDRANSAIAPLCGLPRDLPLLTHGDNDEEWDLDWKFVEVRKLVEHDPRPFVWIDDDIDFLRDQAISPREWADSISVPSLLIAPDTRTGLLPCQLDAVDEFVRQHGGEPKVDETGGP
jgi:uncharacterized protein YegL